MDHRFSDTYIQDNPEEIYEEIKEEAFEYYKKYKNLNDYYYKTENPASRKRIEQWVNEFFERLQGLENQNRTDNEPVLKSILV
jgi:hypothetical protein